MKIVSVQIYKPDCNSVIWTICSMLQWLEVKVWCKYKKSDNPHQLISSSPRLKVTHETKLKQLLFINWQRCLIINVPTVSPVYVCLHVEWRLSAASPSRGVLVLPVSKHPHDIEPDRGGTKPAVSPCSKCFVLEEAPAMAPRSQLHVTRLEMREALVSWTLSPQGWALSRIQSYTIL